MTEHIRNVRGVDEIRANVGKYPVFGKRPIKLAENGRIYAKSVSALSIRHCHALTVHETIYDLRMLAFQRSEPRHEFGNSDVRSHHRRVWRVPAFFVSSLTNSTALGAASVRLRSN